MYNWFEYLFQLNIYYLTTKKFAQKINIVYWTLQLEIHLPWRTSKKSKILFKCCLIWIYYCDNFGSRFWLKNISYSGTNTCWLQGVLTVFSAIGVNLETSYYCCFGEDFVKDIEKTKVFLEEEVRGFSKDLWNLRWLKMTIKVHDKKVLATWALFYS